MLLIPSAWCVCSSRALHSPARLTSLISCLPQRLSDPQPIAIHSAYDQLRHALDAAAARYASHHYQDGVTSAFVQVAPEAQAQEVTPTESADQASAAVDATVAADASSGDGSLAQGLMPPASLEHETPDHGVDSAAELQTHSAASAAPDMVYERLDAEQAEDQPHEAKEDALLSDEMEKTHLSTEPLEPELQTEKADQGAPEAGPTGDEYESKPDSAASAKSWVPASAPTFALYIVGNRYNLANYWAGRWRSTYTFCLPSAADTGAGEAGDSIQVQGKVQVQVHYFEDGNVQLLAEHAPKLSVSTLVNVAAVLSGSASPKDYTLLAEDIVRTIKADEQAYHAALEATLSELAERTFRALRRQLPVTKQKLDWNRVSTPRFPLRMMRQLTSSARR